MKPNKQIHNIDTLEKEIYRQQLIAIKFAKQLENDLEYLRENVFTLATNSIKKERKKDERDSSFIDHLFSNEHVREVVSGITNRVTDHAVEAVDNLIDRLFKKHR